MNQLQIDSLRDFAIEHLPRAQAVMEQVKRYSRPHAEMYMMLFQAAVSARGNAGTTAIEFAAANILESTSLLCSEREGPLTKAERKMLLERLVNEAKELCNLTSKTISWLDSLPSTPEAERDEEEPPAPAIQTPPIAGRLLTTADAAKALGYREQTLRGWSSNESGPIRPLRMNEGGKRSKLLWRGDDILALMKKK